MSIVCGDENLMLPEYANKICALFHASNKKSHAFVTITIIIAGMLMLAGCTSDEPLITDNRTQQVSLRMNEDPCEEGTTSSLTLTGGTTINIEDVAPGVQKLSMSWTGYNKEGWHFANSGKSHKQHSSISPGTGQEMVHDAWNAAGSEFENHIAVLDGRYLVAVKAAFGAAGQYIDVTLENGTVIPCIIGDQKGTENANEYVHPDGSVVEFEVDCYYGLDDNGNIAAPGSVYMWIPEWKSKVKSITTYPNTVGGGTAPASETSSGASSGNSNINSNEPDGDGDDVTVATSSTTGIEASPAEITTHRDWNASDPSSNMHTDPTDDNFSDNFKKYRSYSEDYTPNADNVHPDTTYMIHDVQHKIQSHKYIVLHSTESGSMTAAQVAEMFMETKDEKGAHFIVDRDGTIYQCYEMSDVAYHAGAGDEAAFGLPEPDGGPSGMNMNSIGIEIMHQAGEGDYPEEQLKAVADLIAYIDKNTTGGGVTDKSDDPNCEANEEASSTNIDDDELWFYQPDYPQEYDNGYPISSHGCGCCSTTVAIDLLLNKDYTPDVVARMMREWRNANEPDLHFCVDAGTSWYEWQIVVQGTFGVTVKAISSIEEIKTALQAGHPVVVGGKGTFKNQDGSTRTGGGHVLCFYKYDGNYFYCKDSSSGPSVKWTEAELNGSNGYRRNSTAYEIFQ